ncbi:Hypothetical protein AFL40_0768 [Mycobacterium tuberculosis]|nr:Hypothetical protein AFL40_0768 [Mycobacterium tuberculosis]
MDPLMAHQRAQDAFAALLANVRADQLGGPTPCSEWTINDLIEHVVGGNEQVGRWAASPIEPPARPDGLVAATGGLLFGNGGAGGPGASGGALG